MSAARFPSVMEPLWRFYGDPATASVRMTEPGKVIVGRFDKGHETFDVPELTVERLTEICTALADAANVRFDREAWPSVRCIIPGTDWYTDILIGPSVQSGVSLAIVSRFAAGDKPLRESADQPLSGESTDEHRSADDHHYPGKDPKTACLSEVTRCAKDSEENCRDGVLAEGSSRQLAKDAHQPFHLRDSVLVVNICLVVAACTGDWKFAETLWFGLLMTLAIFSPLLWLMRWKHWRRGSNAWQQARLFQMFLDNDPVFGPLRSAVLVISVVGACLALMPQFDPPGRIDGVDIMATLAGFLCGCNLIEAWLRARVLSKEATR